MSVSMSRRLLVSFALIASVVLLSTDSAEAIRRRRRPNNYRYTSASSMRVASTRDASSTDYSELSAYYDYDQAASEEVAFSDKVRMFLMLHGEEFDT